MGGNTLDRQTAPAALTGMDGIMFSVFTKRKHCGLQSFLENVNALEAQ